MPTNSLDHEVDRLAHTVSDTAQSTGSSAQRKIGEAANAISGAAMKAGGQAKDIYGEVSSRARTAARQVDPYVKGKPYAAMGIVAVAALLIGLIMAGRGPKVIYVQETD
jgi:ElaB/YqjD/DUF883 family membrane-anchored ribosome-binding protein